MSGLETQFDDVAKAVEKVSQARRKAASAQADVSEHLDAFATTEPYLPLAGGIKRLARTLKATADLSAAQAINEQVSLGDALAYQSMNARSAKDTLSSRDSIVDEHRSAVKSTISKRRAVEKMKVSSNIKADRVDEALDDLEEVSPAVSIALACLSHSADSTHALSLSGSQI